MNAARSLLLRVPGDAVVGSLGHLANNSFDEVMSDGAEVGETTTRHKVVPIAVKVGPTDAPITTASQRRDGGTEEELQRVIERCGLLFEDAVR